MTRIYIAIIILSSMLFEAKASSPKREMRGVWIATVANIDWPSTMGLSPTQQRIEMREMLDKLQAHNFNTIVIQIRPTADAFYPSTLEPWSKYLTGKQGLAPTPYYDPLEFIIEEAHHRCMEVHGWINPYRVTNTSDQILKLDKKHIYHKQQKMIVKYGEKYYFDPGLDETRQLLNNVVKDIITRYDVDALHFDDYFYPYPIGGKIFPDEETFKKYPRGYSPNKKDDWRRNNVNMVVKEIRKTIKDLKPWVQFGISPFGVWRNKNKDSRGSETRAGVSNYDDLYADILKWLKEGTIDYVAPQLYWEIGKEVADYHTLVRWWSENSYNQNMYVGLFASGLRLNRTQAWKKGNELARQLQLNEVYPQVDGTIFYSAKELLRNPRGILDTLVNNYFKDPALQPIVKGRYSIPSAQPQNVKIIKDRHEAYLIWDKITADRGYKIAYYVVYGFKGKRVGNMNDPKNIVAITTDNCIDLHHLSKSLGGKNTFVVTSINRFKQESKPSESVSRRI